MAQNKQTIDVCIYILVLFTKYSNNMNLNVVLFTLFKEFTHFGVMSNVNLYRNLLADDDDMRSRSSLCIPMEYFQQ